MADLKFTLLISLLFSFTTFTTAYVQTNVRFSVALGNSKKYMKKQDSVALDSNDNFTRWFRQPVDHFNAENNDSWKQRYFINDAYFNKSNGPVFLCVGGEGPALDSSVVQEKNNVHCSLMVHLAKQRKALIVAAEHRFYGESMPTNDFKTKSLAYLSSQQALADLARLHSHISESYHLDPKSNRWITWGGSYPGMMASFFRLKFPHLIWASVSSSAPVEAIANYQGYNDVVANSLSVREVGGSKDCQGAIATAFAAVGKLLHTHAGRRSLEKMFHVCAPLSLDDPKNQVVFAEGLSYVFPLQSNDPSCTNEYCNIEKICKLFVDDSLGEPIDRLVKLVEADSYVPASQGGCMHISYAMELSHLKDTSLEGGGDRSWFFQTCTEWGFFQTCDPSSSCVFTSSPHLNDLESYFDMCKAIFGVNSSTTEERIHFSNSYYGGKNPLGASRIFYVNGQVDPWKAASVLNSVDDGLPALVVPTASHHFWTHPIKKTDNAYIMEARSVIVDQVEQWLDMDNENEFETNYYHRVAYN